MVGIPSIRRNDPRLYMAVNYPELEKVDPEYMKLVEPFIRDLLP